MPIPAEPCPECGSAPAGGRTCRQAFEAAITLEYENPQVFGRAHPFTVACYNLQHPAVFTEEALAEMEAGLRAMVQRQVCPADFRQALSRKYAGSRRILRRQPAPARLRRWTRTTAHLVLDSGPEAFTASVLAWAESIISDLDRQPR